MHLQLQHKLYVKFHELIVLFMSLNPAVYASCLPECTYSTVVHQASLPSASPIQNDTLQLAGSCPFPVIS